MSSNGWYGLRELRLLSKQELDTQIADLEGERETLEAQRCVVLWRIALLQVERRARGLESHCDAAAVAAALLRRSPWLLPIEPYRQSQAHEDPR
jgi:uncharacterized small protein (DUF1192 family)